MLELGLLTNSMLFLARICLFILIFSESLKSMLERAKELFHVFDLKFNVSNKFIIFFSKSFPLLECPLHLFISLKNSLKAKIEFSLLLFMIFIVNTLQILAQLIK